MGWTDNLESELANQPGPSGLNQNAVQDNDEITTTEIECIGRERDKAHNEKSERKQEKESETSKKKNDGNAIWVFAEKVAISGLLEAYNATFCLDRYMFRMALILAFGMIISQAISIASHYQNQSTVFDRAEIAGKPPFPNVSVCFTSTVSETDEKWFASNFDKQVIENMKKLNLTKTDLQQFLKKFVSLEVTRSDLDTIQYAKTKRFMRMIQGDTGSISALLPLLVPKCSQILSNCAYGNAKFDCCEKAQHLALWQYSCFQISVCLLPSACHLEAI